MKITLAECVRAYQAVMEMMVKDGCDFAFAHALVMARRELEPHMTFYGEKEEALIDKYAKRDEKGEIIRDGNRIQVENMPAFEKERAELNGVEVEISPRKVKKAPESLKPSVLEGLMLILEFPEE